MPPRKRYVGALGRTRRIAPQVVYFFLVSLFAIVALSLLSQSGPTGARGDLLLVQRVIDGNTLELENGERVRLIGVDTAGTRHLEKPVEYYGKQDTNFIQGMVQGKRVWLEFDGIRRKDRLGRTLAYVFLDNWLLLNAEIVKQGYGFTYTLMPLTRMAEFRRLEREAKEQRRGF